MSSARTLYFARVVRTAFAVISSLILAMWLGLTNPYWAPTTVLVVESLSSFEMLDKTYWRLLGSLLGGAIGICIVALSAGTPAVMILVCAISTCATIYLLQKSNPPFWRWVLITLLIVVLYTINNPNNAFLMGVYRVSGVGLGALVVLLSHMIVPAKDSVAEFTDAYQNMTSMLLYLVDRTIDSYENDSATESLPLAKLIALTSSLKQACKLRAMRTVTKRGYIALGNDMESLGRCLVLLNNPILPAPSAQLHVLERLKLIRQQVLCLQARQASTHNARFTQVKTDEPCSWELILTELEGTVDRVCAVMAEKVSYLPSKVTPASLVDTEADLLGGDWLRLYRAAVCAGGVVVAMCLWRFTGWPAGSSLVIVTFATLLYIIIPPHLPLKLLATMFGTASTISGLICILILPQISDIATFIYVIFFFYFTLSLLIQSESPKLRGLASLIAILTNSTANGYAITPHAFNIYSYIVLSIIGAMALSWFIIKIFVPFSPDDIVRIHQEKLSVELQEFSLHSGSSGNELGHRIIARIHAIAGWSAKITPTTRSYRFLLDAFCLQSMIMKPEISHQISLDSHVGKTVFEQLIDSTKNYFQK